MIGKVERLRTISTKLPWIQQNTARTLLFSIAELAVY